MGKIFELISDEALDQFHRDEEKSNFSFDCHICNKDVFTYPYNGKLKLRNGTIDDDFNQVCENCIRKGILDRNYSDDYREKISKYVDSLNLPPNNNDELKKKLIKTHNITPKIPLFSYYEDRPFCCKGITEFTGYPNNYRELRSIVKGYSYWQDKVTISPFKENEFGDGDKNGESFDDIFISFSKFECKSCKSKYYIFQPV